MRKIIVLTSEQPCGLPLGSIYVWNKIGVHVCTCERMCVYMCVVCVSVCECDELQF